MQNNYCAVELLISQYCVNSNLGLLHFAPCKVTPLNLLCFIFYTISVLCFIFYVYQFFAPFSMYISSLLHFLWISVLYLFSWFFYIYHSWSNDREIDLVFDLGEKTPWVDQCTKAKRLRATTIAIAQLKERWLYREQ